MDQELSSDRVCHAPSESREGMYRDLGWYGVLSCSAQELGFLVLCVSVQMV